MARDGLFFRQLAEVHPRFGTPAVSIVAASAWAMVLAVSGTFEQLLTYVVFVGWIFYALGARRVFRYRRRAPDARPSVPRPRLSDGRRCCSSSRPPRWSANTIVAQPGRAAVGIGVVLLGSPVYLVWRRRGAPAGAEPAPGPAGAPPS